MSILTFRLPDAVRTQVEALARRDGITVEQFLASAAAEKVSALQGVEYLESVAAQAKRADWDFVLDRVPARTPLPGDEWPRKEGSERTGS